VDALSVAGVDGRLAARMKGTPAADNARAKTGSMSRLQSLAGYVTTRDGETLAFAIIVNNFSTRPSTVVRAIDRIVVRLAELGAKP
jgi:D-alanyl-D-alanine carboxypeptidase/D-alanyl-D-alanine-endopeptidase (penicillin-binding protein 4)